MRFRRGEDCPKNENGGRSKRAMHFFIREAADRTVEVPAPVRNAIAATGSITTSPSVAKD